MGWEKRRRGGLYYYRPLRINGRPRRRYCGAGFIGRGHENIDRQLRELRVRDRAAARQQAAAHGLWPPLWRLGRTLADAALLQAGWYNHHGEWRPRMATTMTGKTKAKAKIKGRTQAQQPATPALTPPSAPVKPKRRAAVGDLRVATNQLAERPLELARPALPDSATSSRRPPATAAEQQALLQELNGRANRGDAAALAELCAYLDAHPEIAPVLGDLIRHAQEIWLNALRGGGALLRESFRRDNAAWRRLLTDEGSSVIEHALADVAAVARLAMGVAEERAAGATSGTAARDLAVATGRFQDALKAVEQLRRARTPRSKRALAAKATAAPPRTDDRPGQAA